MAWILYHFINTTLNTVLAIISFFVGFRIVLRLFSANQATPFVQWIYGVSELIITPFKGIFPNPVFSNNAVFDIPAFIALTAYALLFYVIYSLISGAMGSRDVMLSDQTHHHAI